MSSVIQALWQVWKAIALRIGHWQARAMLSLFYLVAMLPVAIGVRLATDPLGLRARRGVTRWRSRDYPRLTLEQARRQ